MTGRGRQVRLGLALLGITYVLLELVALGGLKVLEITRGKRYEPVVADGLNSELRDALERVLADRTDYLTYSPVLGWTIKPNGAFRAIYRAQGQGLRGDHEYAPEPPRGRRRIASFGDSFTHGDEVGNGDTWERAMEAADSTLEVLNFGVSGYGLDQAYLRYREDGVGFHAPIVLIGFMSENLNRGVNVFRPFYARGNREPWTKPRFALKDSTLVLLENPMPRLELYRELLDHPERMLPVFGEHDYFYQTKPTSSRIDVLPSVRLIKIARQTLMLSRYPIEQNGTYLRTSEAYQVALRTFDQFVQEVRRNGGRPIIVLFPNQGDLRRFRRIGEWIYRPLRQDLATRGYEVIDVLDGFADKGKNYEVPELVPGHYSLLGNRLVAEQILNYLGGPAARRSGGQ